MIAFFIKKKKKTKREDALMVTKGQSFSRHNLEVKLVTNLHIVVRYSSVCVSHSSLLETSFSGFVLRLLQHRCSVNSFSCVQ